MAARSQTTLGRVVEFWETHSLEARIVRLILGAAFFGALIARAYIRNHGAYSEWALWPLSLAGGAVHYGIFLWFISAFRRANDGRPLQLRLLLYGELIVAALLSIAVFETVSWLVGLASK